MKNNIVLIGFMGAGKTTLGGLISHSLEMGLFDVDLEIEKQTKMTIAQIFNEFGEEHFRELEHEMCKKKALMQGQGHVIATGGGILKDKRNLPLLQKTGTVIYLKADIETLYERIKGDVTRPLLRQAEAQCASLQIMRELLNERETGYTTAADFMVNTDGLSPEEACQEVLAALSSRVKP